MRTSAIGDETAVEQVLQPAGRGHEQVRVVRPLGLRAERRAAEDGCDPEAASAADGAELFRDLLRELARRYEDERCGLRVRRCRPLDDRQPESQRLAGAGRRLGEDVHTRERVRKDDLLDGERGDDLACSERLCHVGAHTELAE